MSSPFSTVGGELTLPLQLTNEVSSNVAKRVPAAIVGTGASIQTAIELTKALASGDQAAVASISGVTPAAIEAGVAALRIALIRSYQVLYYISVGLGTACIVVCCCLNSKLIQSRLTPEIARKLQNVGTVANRP